MPLAPLSAPANNFDYVEEVSFGPCRSRMHHFTDLARLAARLDESKIQFHEIAKEAGIEFHNQLWFPNKKISASTLALLAIYPSTSISDVDSDGRPDLLLTDAHPAGGMKLYLNRSQPGRPAFEEASRQYGLGPDSLKPGSSRALFGDVNHDGKIDLVIARFGCHEVCLARAPIVRFRARTTPFRDIVPTWSDSIWPISIATDTSTFSSRPIGKKGTSHAHFLKLRDFVRLGPNSLAENVSLCAA